MHSITVCLSVAAVLVLGMAASTANAADCCAQLGWNTRAGRDNNICATSEFGSRGCLDAVTYDEAVAICAINGNGARLCTAGEIAQGEAAETGCGFDTRQVWTSTSCPGGAIVAPGDGVSGATECRASTDRAFLRCCSQSDCDTAVATTAAPAPVSCNCTRLGWPATAGVCGGTVRSGGACPTARSWADANNYCENVMGARLCSAREAQAGIPSGSGCGLDDKYIWTSTPCTGGYFSTVGDYLLGFNIGKRRTLFFFFFFSKFSTVTAFFRGLLVRTSDDAFERCIR